ncbi:MAG: nitric oxide reductase F protein [Alphaproteobacteria bacterium]|nr:nitric oxide reductase F protein [Alphaproteobacteria bacterium]
MRQGSIQTDRLIRTWLLLAVLSIATTALTMLNSTGGGRYAIGLGVLLLAGAKARLILRDYLGLAASVFWMRAFELSIGLFLAAAFVLFAAGS